MNHKSNNAKIECGSQRKTTCECDNKMNENLRVIGHFDATGSGSDDYRWMWLISVQRLFNVINQYGIVVCGAYTQYTGTYTISRPQIGLLGNPLIHHSTLFDSVNELSTKQILWWFKMVKHLYPNRSSASNPLRSQQKHLHRVIPRNVHISEYIICQTPEIILNQIIRSKQTYSLLLN